MYYERLYKALIADEGCSPTVYLCPAGKRTIGIGRNLDDVGFRDQEARNLTSSQPDRDLNDFSRLIITRAEALMLMENDVAVCEDFAKKEFHNWENLNDARQEVIINMIFNLGRGGFLGFRNFRIAIKNEDFALARLEMLNSKWATIDVPKRAMRLAQIMETGEYE